MSDFVSRKIPRLRAFEFSSPPARWVDHPASISGKRTVGSTAPLAYFTLGHVAGRTARVLICLLASWLAWAAPVYAQFPVPLAQPDLDLRQAQGGYKAVALSDGGALIAHSGRFIGGDTERAQWGVYRLRPDGSVDAVWRADAGFVVRDIAVVDDDVYLAGQFSGINGQSRRGLARLSLSTGALSDWNPNNGSTTSYEFRTLTVVGSALYVGGRFTQIGTTARTHLAKIDRLTGILDPFFNPSISTSVATPVLTLASDGSALFVGGPLVGTATHALAPARYGFALSTRGYS